jgi:hypothetical protein
MYNNIIMSADDEIAVIQCKDGLWIVQYTAAQNIRRFDNGKYSLETATEIANNLNDQYHTEYGVCVYKLN